MFTTKAKRNYRAIIFSLVIVTLCLLIVAIAWPTEPVEAEEESGNAPSGLPAETGEPVENQPELSNSNKDGNYVEDGEFPTSGSQPSEGQDLSDNVSENEENSMNQVGQSYYLVKRAGDDIAVFFCDENGTTVQLETTQILYEMLGPEDQKLFDEGIRVESQEKLSVLLQDFEG